MIEGWNVSCIILNICLCILLLRESFETSHSASRFQHMFGMNSCVNEKYKHGVYDSFYNMDIVCFNFKFLSIYVCLPNPKLFLCCTATYPTRWYIMIYKLKKNASTVAEFALYKAFVIHFGVMISYQTFLRRSTCDWLFYLF